MSAVLVTGATGVIGRRVVPLLVTAGHDVGAVARTEQKATELRRAGATALDVDLFDTEAVERAVEGYDVVIHLATNIPTGASAATRRGWAVNDRLRSVAAANLSRAAIATGVTRYIQESITFPYLDCGDSWIDESTQRAYFWGNRTTVEAEQAAQAITAAGATGVALRFAMFMSTDSAHMRTFAQMARRGLWGVFGDDDAFISFIDADDAASAVVAALDAPAGVYNIAEDDPARRGEQRVELASAVGRDRLRAMPGLMVRAGGDGAASLARSHRISSAAFRSATTWVPTRRPIERWAELA